MRCKACDALLTDYEATRKDKDGNFIDLCGQCYFPSAGDDENETLKHESDVKLLDSDWQG